MTAFRLASLPVLTLLVVACEVTAPTSPGDASFARVSGTPRGAPSLILHNGHVISMDGARGRSRRGDQAIALHGDRVMRVGSDAQILRLRKPWTTVVDLDGATVMPGIVDPHTHLFNDAWRLGLDLEGAQDLALRMGITTLANLFVNSSFLAQMQDFTASGALRVRTSLYLIYTDNCGVPQGDWWQSHPPTRGHGERLRIGGIKLFADGGTCGEPAVSVEFSEGAGFGELFLTAEQIAVAIRQAETTGHQAVIHAIGDRAVKAAQDGIEAGLEGRPNRLRHRIDHNVLVPDELISRYAEIGIQPVLFGYLPLGVMDPQWGTCAGAPRNAFYQAFEGNTRQFLDELPRQRVAWHGDDPWIGPVNPFRELYSMVTRVRGGQRQCPPPDWQLSTRITASEGLEMMTTNSAYAIFRENEVGRLKPGMLADLIVLSGDPSSAEPDDLWDIEVRMTMIDGQVEFCEEGWQALCPGWTES